MHINGINRETEEIGLEVNKEKTKCLLMSRHQNEGQNRTIKTANGIFLKLRKIQIFGGRQ